MQKSEKSKVLKLWQAAEVKLSYSTKVQMTERPQIRSSRDAADLFYGHWPEDLELRESFYVLLLNRANRVNGIYQVSTGGIAGTVVDAKLVFAAALKSLSCAVILAHNHPSGNLQPSQADLELTRKLKDAGQTLDILVLDHLILTRHGYYSFADEGLI
jgi:DNA repair protein RadC